jgi:hypothetical protein
MFIFFQTHDVRSFLYRYRARDLSNVSTLLYCQTEPVIESSKNVSFGCFSFAYMYAPSLPAMR